MSDKTKDNITDFSKYVAKMRLERSEEQSEHLKGYLLSLKKEMDTSDFARRALKTAVTSMTRAIIFLRISHYVEGALRECGLNPDDFLIDTQSYEDDDDVQNSKGNACRYGDSIDGNSFFDRFMFTFPRCAVFLI